MPSFVNTVDLVLDGERVRITTRASDQLNAERGIGKNPMDSPVELGMRVWWCALRRARPDLPAAKDWRTFVEALEASDDVEPEDEIPGVEPLDPTRPAALDD